MLKKGFSVVTLAAALSVLPALSQAQSSNNKYPLGSKQNPIKPTSSSPASPGKSSKGKRGSKTNPIAGGTHPRVKKQP